MLPRLVPFTTSSVFSALSLKNLSDDFMTVDGREREHAGISVYTDIRCFPGAAAPLRDVTAGCFCYAMFYSAQSRK